MQKFASALAVLALVGGVTLTGCTETAETKKGVVSAFDMTGKTATIDGVDYTVADNVNWPMDLAPGDSVSYGVTGTQVTALDKINRMGAAGDSMAAGADSLAAGADSAAAAMGNMVDSAQAGAADALQGAATALDSAAQN